ncbi:cyclin-A1-4-like isoform X2 [Macadamia integrifolia]|uniref:cyclin-A1-4-like isoform X2 n=1 Tax=Macadamia integrifolia TaxID=60698 RepID=UPI001C52BF0C|nr:cyclin-A1-4-like isoform X2 [Macadamia integrifolia]
MSTRNRRSSLSMASSSSAAKRPASSENATKVSAVQPLQAKKRPALTNLTNQNNVSRSAVRPSGTVATQVSSATKTAKIKKVSSSHAKTAAVPRSSMPESSSMKSSAVGYCKDVSTQRSDGPVSSIAAPLAPCSVYISPSRSDGCSVSMDETMSTCDSLKSPDIEYIDSADVSAVASIERRTCNNLYISDHVELPTDKIVDVDDNYQDPQLCATIACDIYKHLRASETKKRPSTSFMEEVQKDINPSMRAILIDWLVEVAEEYRLVPDTLYLTINYIDRYLSGNVMNRQRLQLLGVACMMIAAKYEEICAPQVEEFCYITDNTYFKEEVLQMETAVLNYLKFEMTAPTTKCFLRRFVRAAQGSNEVPLLQLECQANYVAELSLLEYGMLCYAPSLIAASSIFLANFILQPSKRPWNATLGHYTSYKPSELHDCVKALHHLACNSHNTTLLAIREKYSQHKYKFVAKKYCSPSIPVEYFHDLGN